MGYNQILITVAMITLGQFTMVKGLKTHNEHILGKTGVQVESPYCRSKRTACIYLTKKLGFSVFQGRMTNQIALSG